LGESGGRDTVRGLRVGDRVVDAALGFVVAVEGTVLVDRGFAVVVRSADAAVTFAGAFGAGLGFAAAVLTVLVGGLAAGVAIAGAPSAGASAVGGGAAAVTRVTRAARGAMASGASGARFGSSTASTALACWAIASRRGAEAPDWLRDRGLTSGSSPVGEASGRVIRAARCGGSGGFPPDVYATATPRPSNRAAAPALAATGISAAAVTLGASTASQRWSCCRAMFGSAATRSASVSLAAELDSGDGTARAPWGGGAV
jgi:hypothetical protein